MSIDDILATLDPKTRKRVQLATGVDPTRVPVPSIGLNFALKGGLGKGRQTLIWGPKSAGKSSFCLQLIAEAQQQGQTVAWIDAEASYSAEWAAKFGVDSDKVIYAPVKTTNDMVDVVGKLMQADVDVIVVDSISALLPAIYFEKDGEELKDLVDTKQIGAEARDMTNAVKMLNYANKDTALILISQQRNSFGSMHATHIPTGGMAVQFFSSTIIKLWSSDSDKTTIKGEVAIGDKILQEKVGRIVTWTIDKNKLGPQSRTGDYNFYYQGDRIGIDFVAEILDLSGTLGIIEVGGGGNYVVDGVKVRGRDNAVQYLRDNPLVLNKIREELYDKF